MLLSATLHALAAQPDLYAQHTDGEILLFRPNDLAAPSKSTVPAIGRKSALDLVKSDGTAVSWHTDGAAASELGDLGYTYG